MRFNGASLRTWHANISAFIAPMVLFFSLSGTLQIFDLHQSHGPYHAPAVLTAIGQLHKDQVFAPLPARPPKPARDAGGPSKQPAHTPSIATYVLKWLFALEALGLATTTVFGVWIGLTHAKRKRTVIALLAVGTLLPLLFIGL